VADQVPDLPVEQFPSARAWERWLARNHARSPGVWLEIAKKGAAATTVSYPEAVDVALCYGWIDGVRHKKDETYFRQRFTPRTRTSKWSKINRDKVEALVAAGRMQPSGQAAVDAARADGRWDAAYAGSRSIEVPDDLARALRRNARAHRAFETLDSRNRYSIVYRVNDAKRPETRARRIETFVVMLAEGRTIH
jgi:uncharacterized protein YdeI (YjbR/CyaY-like superfamily)